MRRVRHAALVVLSLALAHEAVYLVHHEHGAAAGAIGREGHDYWPAFLAAGLGGALLIGAWWAWRLAHRVRAAATCPAARAAQPASFGAEWRLLLRRLAPTVASLFLVQENVEHLLLHGQIEGLATYLAPGAELTLPLVLAVVATIAAVGALARWQEVVLIARLRLAAWENVAGASEARSSAPAGWDITAALVHLRLLLAADSQRRAPPTTSIA